MDEGIAVLEDLRSELEALLAELEDKNVSGSITRIREVKKRGQDILDEWVEENANWTEERSSFCVPFGPLGQISYVFNTASFGIDPAKADSPTYSWYVIFGDALGNCAVFATND